jgi:hypothetical protein
MLLSGLLAVPGWAPGGGAPLDTGDPYGAPDEIRRGFAEILEQPEFRRLRTSRATPEHTTGGETPEWLRRLIDRIVEFLRGGSGMISKFGFVYQVLAYTALAAVSALIVYLVVRAVNNYRHRSDLAMARSLNAREGEADLPPGDLPTDVYLRQAEVLAADGRFREAVGQLILGGMSHTERQSWIRFRAGLTHRDYLKALRPHEVEQRAFRMLVGIYEPICFGRRPARREHFDQALQGYLTGFGGPTRLAAAREADQ